MNDGIKAIVARAIMRGEITIPQPTPKATSRDWSPETRARHREGVLRSWTPERRKRHGKLLATAWRKKREERRAAA